MQKESKFTSKPFVRCLTWQSEMKWNINVEKGEIVSFVSIIQCESESSFSTSDFCDFTKFLAPKIREISLEVK